MSHETHDNSEEIKHMLSATMRTLSGMAELDITFSPHEAPVGRLSTTGAPRVPAPTAKMSAEELKLIRGCADAQALYMRHHDKKLHNKLAPMDTEAREAFNALEQARCEALGARAMEGVKSNMNAVLAEKCKRAGFDSMKDAAQISTADALHVMARLAMTGEKAPNEAENLLKLWQPLLEKQFHGVDFSALIPYLNDQEAFARNARQILKAMEVLPSDQDEDDGEIEQEDGAPEHDEEDNSQDNEDQDSEQDQNEQQDIEEELEASEDELDDLESQFDDTPEDSDSHEMSGEEAAGPSAQSRETSPHGPHGLYTVYTTAFDEEVGAEELADQMELSRLRDMLDKQLASHAAVITKLANRLQRKLMAQQQRSWRFDLEEGIIHAPRLARIIANPTVPLTFKQEQEQEFKDTVVTLLIDNSGSMRGRPIGLAAMSADIIARTMERCGIKVEILGFTTRGWKGGKARELWMENGRPPQPGRLNDIRHIIYKAADAPMRRTRKNIGLMLKEGILKENIDGEALVWAYNRLIKRREARKILMVISDGAPVDDSTLSVNPSNILEADLRHVINWIERQSPIELSAIGIGHDVTRYYARAMTISDADELAGALAGQLSDLFDDV